MTYFTWISFPRLQFRLFYDVTSTLCKVLQSNMLLLRITVLDTVTRQTVMSLCSFFCRTWKFDQRWTHIYSCTHTTISWLQFPRGEMKAWSAVSEERRYELWFLLFKRTRRQIANRTPTLRKRLQRQQADTKRRRVMLTLSSESLQHVTKAAMSIRPAALWPPVLQQNSCPESNSKRKRVCVCVFFRIKICVSVWPHTCIACYGIM